MRIRSLQANARKADSPAAASSAANTSRLTPRPAAFALLCLFAATAATSPAAETSPSIFPDKNLEAVVRTYVFAKRDNQQPLTAEDVKSLSTISGRGKGIRDLTGLDKCTALAQLELTDGEITDLTPLKNLTNLQSLTLSRNKIRDIGPLAGLLNLQYLELSGNEVTDLKPLEKLTAMNSLYLSNNRITDIAPVQGLARVWSLYLDGNTGIADLKPVAGLKNLSTLDLKKTKVKDLSPLAGLTALHYLFLDGTAVADLAPLISMCQKDGAGEKRFAPFLTVSLAGAPAAKTPKVAELKKHIHTLLLTPQP